MAELGPVVLEGRFVRLEPLAPSHAVPLLAAAQAPEIWTSMPTALTTRAAIDRWIAEALERAGEGREFAFAVVVREGGRVVGSTRYMDVQAAHRGVEIGWTWYAPDVWGTAVNPEAKYVLLQHAFEEWGAIRVCLKTDARNLHSQAAIRKLGAHYEGTLRSHRIRQDGTARDSVLYSIVRQEWPEVRAALEQRIDAAGINLPRHL